MRSIAPVQKFAEQLGEPELARFSVFQRRLLCPRCMVVQRLLVQQSSLVAKVAIGLIGALFFAASLFLALFSLTRGRLVLDRDSRELTFYPFWFSFRPHRRIFTDDIKALSTCEFYSAGDSDDPGHTYNILVAELRDGRLASIAVDSPLSIEIELKQAIGFAK